MAVRDRTRYASEQAVIVRCPCCGGLREISGREFRRQRTGPAVCSECARGHVVTREEFYEFWTSRFSAEEITAMGKAIWG